jgi:hypothetical protein
LELTRFLCGLQIGVFAWIEASVFLTLWLSSLPVYPRDRLLYWAPTLIYQETHNSLRGRTFSRYHQDNHHSVWAHGLCPRDLYSLRDSSLFRLLLRSKQRILPRWKRVQDPWEGTLQHDESLSRKHIDPCNSVYITFPTSYPSSQFLVYITSRAYIKV